MQTYVMRRACWCWLNLSDMGEALLERPTFQRTGKTRVRNDRGGVETSASFEARFRATTLPDQLKRTQEATIERRLAMSLTTPRCFQKLQTAHMQWLRRLRESSPRADAVNLHVRSMSGVWKRKHVGIVRHRQLKGR